MTITPEQKIKNLMDSLSYSGLVLLALDDLASKLARLAARSPDFDIEFARVRESVLTDLKNIDMTGRDLSDEARAISRALATVGELLDGVYQRAKS